MKFRFGIRTKLIGIINIILLAAAGAIVIFATTLFSKDNVARIQEGNLDAARLLASEVRNDLTNLTEKMRLIGVSILHTLTPEQLESLQRQFYEQDKDVIAVTVYGKSSGRIKSFGQSTNKEVVRSLEVPVDDILSIHAKVNPEKLFTGQEAIQSDQIKGTIPVVTISIPLQSDDKGNVTHAAIATVKQDRFLRAVKSDGLITSYLVDGQGYLLAHPEQERVLKKENRAHLEVVKQLLSGKTNNGQTRFTDPTDQIIYLGAFKVVGFGGIGVISQVEEAKALEAARKVKSTSILITGMVSIVGFLIVFFFSLSLTTPILKLVDATDAVAQGNYEIQLKKGANDEIGDLTKSFNQMIQGLAEREKIKTAFSKFHSKEMADKVLSGELKLGGERKTATVFFSDVRGFTALSENMDPEELVKILNRYMTRMVRVIISHGGIVDKYVGDAIMAVWGVPLTKEGDVQNAIRACIEMRKSLAELNDELKGEGLPPLKIGMGLNYGPLISGNIGSEERMEFTVIGDTVNTASRIESMTKEFGTDMLVSQAVLDQVPGKFIIEKAQEVKVKGKTEPLAVFKVRGYIDETGKEVIVETAYSSYKAEKSDKVVHDKPAAAAPAAELPVAEAPATEAPSEQYQPLGLDDEHTEGTIILPPVPPPFMGGAGAPPPFKGASVTAIPPPFKGPKSDQEAA